MLHQLEHTGNTGAVRVRRHQTCQKPQNDPTAAHRLLPFAGYPELFTLFHGTVFSARCTNLTPSESCPKLFTIKALRIWFKDFAKSMRKTMRIGSY